MSRIRTIKPEFFLDEDVAALNPLTRLLYISLWCLADKAGRLEDRPQRIKIQSLPYDKIDVDAELNVLVERGFIVRYTVDDLKLIEIKSFLKHQRPHNTEKESDLPPFNGEITVKEPLNNGYETTGKEGKGRERKGKEHIKAAEQEPFRLPLKEEIEHASKAMTLESINRVSDELYKSGKWKDVHACKNKLLKECKNERAILHALIRIYLKDPPPDEPWAYCVQIMKQEDGNFNARDYEKNQGRSP